MCNVLRDYLPAVISGLFTFAGVFVGVKIASGNISRQIKSNYDLQQQQIDFQQSQARKALLREKAELLHAKLLRVEELSFDAHKISLNLDEPLDYTIPKYEAVRVELFREVLGCISLIEIYFPEIQENENFNRTDVFMRQGAIQNLISSLKHYDGYKNGGLSYSPKNKKAFEEDLARRILSCVSEMEAYLTKPNINNLMEELRKLMAAKYV